VDVIAINGLNTNGSGGFGLGSGWDGGHDGNSLDSVGMVEGTRVVFAEPGVLEGVRAGDFVCVGEEEPEVAKGFPWNKLELGKSILVGGRSSEVGDKGVDGRPGWKREPYRGSGVVEASWHCRDIVVRVFIAVRGFPQW
jgi:hypothetical protein